MLDDVGRRLLSVSAHGKADHEKRFVVVQKAASCDDLFRLEPSCTEESSPCYYLYIPDRI